MAIEIGRRLVASGGHLRSPVLIPESMQIDGADYVKFCKSDWTTIRLLCGDGVTGRPLAKTDILEKLAKMRNDVYNNIADNMFRGDKEDLGLDVAPKRRRKIVEPENMPITAELDAPSFEGFDAHRLRVRLSKSGSLWIELTPRNLEYLHIAVTKQIADGLQKAKPDASEQEVGVNLNGIKGLSFSASRNSIRAYTTCKGKVVTKYFKLGGDTSNDDQVVAATTWLQEHTDTDEA